MFKVRNYSISQKLTWMNMLVSGAALLLACAAFAAYEIEDFRATMVRSLSIQAQIVGANSASALLFNDPAWRVSTYRRWTPHRTSALPVSILRRESFRDLVAGSRATNWRLPRCRKARPSTTGSRRTN